MTVEAALDALQKALDEGRSQLTASQMADLVGACDYDLDKFAQLWDYEELTDHMKDIVAVERKADQREAEARERVTAGLYHVNSVTGETYGPGGPYDSPGDRAVEGGKA